MLHYRRLPLFLLLFILIGIIGVSGCYHKETVTTPRTLKDLAFDTNKKFGYTVYIQEYSEFIPYLVLTSDYNDNALLLRKYLLDQDHTFNDINYGYASYYRDSSIDQYLNKEYFSSLDTSVQNLIVESEITITDKSSRGKASPNTESIIRQVFLLSYTEVGLPAGSFVSREGGLLRYFKDDKNQIAYKSNNEPWSYWLRTSSTESYNLAWAIGPHGIYDGVQIDRKNGVRPAFRLNNAQEIELNTEILPGQSVYVLKLN